MFKLKTIAVAAGLMALPAMSQAAAPTLSEVLGASGITVSGAIDTSYDWSDVDAPVTNHQFDVNPNTFSFHQANFLITKDFGSGVSLTLNPIMGDDATLIGGSDVDLFQGYLSYASGDFTVSAGRMATLAGFEVVNPAGNANASRSLLFFNQPFVHTGVRASYKLSDMLSFTLGINNAGFGAGKVDGDTKKTIEAQVAFTPMSSLAMYLTAYSGEGDASPTSGFIPAMGSPDTTATFVDFVTVYTLSDMISFGLNADYSTAEISTGGTADSSGVALYSTVNVLPKLSVSVRGEYFTADDAGFLGGKVWGREGTLTVAYAVTDALKVMVEARNDQYDAALSPVFPISPRTVGVPNDDVNTATLKAIYKF